MVNQRVKKINLIFLIVGLLFIILGFFFIIFDYLSNNYQEVIEQKALDDFYIEESEVNNEITITQEDEEKISTEKVEKINYIATIRIPKINLIKGLVSPSSYLNNIKYGIQILVGSKMPDEKKTNLILASHSGTARISYFKNLDKLSIDDEVIIDYKNNAYTYKVVRIYDINKNGKANLIYNKNRNNLILITCRYKTNKQIILVCELENK